MHRHSRLRSLQRTADKNLRRLDDRSVELRFRRTAFDSRRVEYETSSLVIELQNTWVNTCRAFMLSCYLGTTSTSGLYIESSVNFESEDNALRHMILKFRPKAEPTASGSWPPYFEPKWYDPGNLLKLAQHTNLANVPQLSDCFSLGFYVFGDLPVARNYFAHRNMHTKAKAMGLAPKYGSGVFGKPSDFLLFVPSRTGVSVLETWIGEIRTTLTAMCN